MTWCGISILSITNLVEIILIERYTALLSEDFGKSLQ